MRASVRSCGAEGANIMRLYGRTILLTGGTRGIGRALLDGVLRENPAAVIVVARDQALLDTLAASDSRIVPYCADLADPIAVDELVQWVTTQHPALSVLINNAGVQVIGDFVAPDADTLVPAVRREIRLNFDSVVALTLGLMPILSRREAMIVTVTSGLALAPKQSAPVYCATKAGLRSFTKALRDQAAARAPQLTVIEALPPLVDTEMTHGRGNGKISAEACAEEILRGIGRDRTTIYVGKSKLLRAIQGLSPHLADRIMRNG